MCGIAGYIDFKKSLDKSHLLEMTDCLTYRGPDSSGYEFMQNESCNIGFGQRRLSIIDLSPLGHQPMFSDDKQQVIVFNGEVYNYEEIKRMLISKGHSFLSHSDTEVILKAYLEWGPSCLEKFIGMFSIVIWDNKKQQVFIARDRAGVKPLYYYWQDDIFLFASELKSFFQVPGFKKVINTESVQQFLQYSFVPAPYSIFQNAWKLEPGYYMIIDVKTKSVDKHRYWNVLDYYKKEKITISEEDAESELERRLKKACEYRMVSDVPVGLFLSGGYDSSLVAAMLQTERTQKIKTYTIGFPDEKYNEAGHAKNVATHLSTDHHEMYCTNSEVKSIIPELPLYYDEPFGDSSAIPTILISRFARKSVTVALSADGGDEIFAGYERHAALLNLQGKYDSVPKIARASLSFALNNLPDFILRKVIREKNISADNLKKYANFFKGNSDLLDMIDYANQTVMPSYGAKFINKPSNQKSDLFEKSSINTIPGTLDKLLAFDYLSYLPNDIMTKVDRATMSTSLEGREPLLDQNIIEWVAPLPDKFKYNNGVSKYLLRKIVHKYLPEQIMKRPKMGFSVPLVIWFREDLKFLFEESLSDDMLNKHGLFNNKKVREELDAYYAGNNFGFPLLWNLFMFQRWYDKWMN